MSSESDGSHRVLHRRILFIDASCFGSGGNCQRSRDKAADAVYWSEFWPFFGKRWDCSGDDECQDWLSLHKSVVLLWLRAFCDEGC